MGILISSLTVILIFITIRHLTKNDASAILGCLIYVLLPITSYFSSSHVETTLSSSFFVLLLFFLYLTDNGKERNTDAIIFCSTLTLFFRAENVVFIPLLVLYLVRKFGRLNKWGLSNGMIGKLAIAYLFTTTITALLMSPVFSINQEIGAAHMISYSGIQSRLISFHAVLVSHFSPILFFALVLGIAYLLIIKKRYYSLMVFFLLIAIYLLFPVYEEIGDKYFFTLVPTIITLIGLGIFSVYNLDRRTMWKILVVIVFLALILCGLNTKPFSRFGVQETSKPLLGADLINKESTLIYGPVDSVYCYHRFYDYAIPFEEAKNQNEYEFLIYFSGDPISTDNKSVEMITKIIERNTYLNISLLEATRTEYLYSIN
jgi:hypothetical protein